MSESFDLNLFLENATTAEFVVAGICFISFVALLYLITKIIKYAVLAAAIIGGLFYFNILNVEMFKEFDEKYHISDKLDEYLEKYNPDKLKEVQEHIGKIQNVDLEKLKQKSK